MQTLRQQLAVRLEQVDEIGRRRGHAALRNLKGVVTGQMGPTRSAEVTQGTTIQTRARTDQQKDKGGKTRTSEKHGMSRRDAQQLELRQNNLGIAQVALEQHLSLERQLNLGGGRIARRVVARAVACRQADKQQTARARVKRSQGRRLRQKRVHAPYGCYSIGKSNVPSVAASPPPSAPAAATAPVAELALTSAAAAVGVCVS